MSEEYEFICNNSGCPVKFSTNGQIIAKSHVKERCYACGFEMVENTKDLEWVTKTKISGFEEPCCEYQETCEYVKNGDQENCCIHEGSYDSNEANKWCQPCQESMYP